MMEPDEENDLKMLHAVEDFEDYDDEYLAELDNLNGNFTHDDEELVMQEYLSGSRTSNNDEYSKSLVPTEEEEDIDSEEEKDILRGIRDEIESKVRDEMKDELQFYQNKLLALEAGQDVETNTEKKKEEDAAEEGEKEMDPKLKEAIAKMRKLDRILMKKVRKEKQVKRDRMLMEKRLREEVSQMKHGSNYFSEIKMNTEKFLALAAPPSHNAGVTLEDVNSDLPPLFQTEVSDSEIKRCGKQSSHEDRNDENLSQQGSPEHSSSINESSRDGSRASKTGNKGKDANSQKDFIKRNKELAAASNEVIAMTDDEKKRLYDLLEDVDELPDLEEGLDGTSSVDFQLALNSGDGFIPDDIELKTLTNIDAQLKNVMADDDYNSVVSSSVQSTPRQPLFTHVGVRTAASFLDGFGERVLYETKEERDLKARLHAIEKELEVFKAPQETETSRTDYHLTDEQLDKLLDQCARSTSQMSVMETPDSSARSNVSSRQALMANPPKLSDEQLQQLLSEAHFPMSSQLLALREDDDKMMDGDGRTEIIRAETWKTIVDENLDSHNPADALPDSPGLSNSNTNDNYGTENDFNTFSEHDRINMKHSSDFGEHSSAVSSSNNYSESLSSLPRINSSNNLPRQSLSESNRSGCASPTNLRESHSSMDSVRFPKISSNSFLIHAPQGLNNEAEKVAPPTHARQPLNMVRNDLSEMRLDSFSEDERNISDRRVQRLNSPAIPRPPPGNKPRDFLKDDQRS